jgi:hypothetical protein
VASKEEHEKLVKEYDELIASERAELAAKNA